MTDVYPFLRGCSDPLFQTAADEIERLRSRLAEAEALLREARDPVEHTANGALNLLHTEVAQDLFELVNRIDAFLARHG